MKTEELTEIGLTEEQIQKVFAINGKDIEATKAKVSALESKISTLETERDGFKGQLETAKNALKSFDGIDPKEIQNTLKQYETDLANAKADYEKKLAARDQRDWLNAKLGEDGYNVTSPYARRQIIADVQSEDKGLPWRDGAYLGFDDFMAAAKKQDPNLYQTAEEKESKEQEQEQEENKPQFTGPTGNDGAKGDGKKYTPPKIF